MVGVRHRLETPAEGVQWQGFQSPLASDLKLCSLTAFIWLRDALSPLDCRDVRETHGLD